MLLRFSDQMLRMVAGDPQGYASLELWLLCCLRQPYDLNPTLKLKPFYDQMRRMVAGDEGYGRREPAERLTRRLGRLPEEVRLLQSFSIVFWVGVRCDQQSQPGQAGLWYDSTRV